jgi:hypothetical protein
MRKAGVGAFAVVAVLALAGLLFGAVTDDRRLAFTLGVQPAQVVAVLAPGDEACQRPIDVSETADRIIFPVATGGRRGPPLDVSVRSPSGAGTVTVPGRYVHLVSAPALGLVKDGTRVAVCVKNTGGRRVGLRGGPGQAARTSELYVGGRRTIADMTLVFERVDATSMASFLPDVLDRAALFTAGWVSPALLWVLGALFLLGVPLLLALALGRANEPSA